MRALVLALAFLASGCDCGRPPIEPLDDGGVPFEVDAGEVPDAGHVADGGVDAGPEPWVVDGGVVASFGPELLPAVRARVEAHLRQVVPQLGVIPADVDPVLTGGAVHLAFGLTASARRLRVDLEAATLAQEGFLVLTEPGLDGGARALAVGEPSTPRATAFAAYALLEELGFAFLHPLAPTRPAALAPMESIAPLREVPRWPVRRIHLHTQHPLELTDMLQGWGPGGPADEAGFTASLAEWDTYLEWLLANRQNGVEWFLLYADSWKDFADSTLRQQRLTTLVDRAHALGIEAGLDVPIVFGQQHSWRLLREERPDDEATELAEIRGRLDWVLAAGFDFLGTESGTSEFTAPDSQRMLDWMNEVTSHAARSGVQVFMKVHASAGQEARGFTDPHTGGPLNFNFLPHYADPRLGVLPHTVQAYGLSDPAPVYGNQDFSEIVRFTAMSAGRRPTLFYPESAYWVSVDVDVPLFLPLYAQRRLADLRQLARLEDANGFDVRGARLDGQLVFSSGWEWGYWLNDVVAARAAWNPRLSLGDAAAFEDLLAPALRPMGAASADVGRWLADFVDAESRLLVFGELNGARPSTLAQRNGFGYLPAWDTWDDLSKLTGLLPPTQPDRLGLVDLRNPLHGGASYSDEVAPLLTAMDTTFAALATRGEALRGQVPSHARDLMDELADAARMTALRARQVEGLYRYVDGYWDWDQAPRMAALARARAALDEAATVVAGREPRYRVPLARVAAWSPNPTAYAFRYLWMVHRLYGWWRDEGKAVDVPLFPCYLNVINPVDVGFGEGLGTDAVRFIGGALSSDQQRGCLAEPSSEPIYPQDNLRSRP